MTVEEAVSAGPIAWGPADVPDMTGRAVIVTGASSGLGLLLSRRLAGRGATVLMAVRDPEKGERVREGILAARPAGELEVWRLDLLDLDSVRRFAEGVRDDGRPIDVLVNNAGIANRPRQLSPQGHESQLATNHLGHFALTGLLLDVLARGGDPRVVVVGSVAYRRFGGALDFDDLRDEKGYSPGRPPGCSSGRAGPSGARRSRWRASTAPRRTTGRRAACGTSPRTLPACATLTFEGSRSGGVAHGAATRRPIAAADVTPTAPHGSRGGSRMEAVRVDVYGGEGVLGDGRVEGPIVGSGRVLVRVKAAIDPADGLFPNDATAEMPIPAAFPSG